MSKTAVIAHAGFAGGYDLGDPRRIEVREGFGRHGLVMLDYPPPRNQFSQVVPEYTPAMLRWGVAPLDVRDFYGYVNHHELREDDSGRAIMRLYCLGTSLTMNTPRSESWAEVSASFIAKQVARRHGLRAVLHRSKDVIPQWSQGHESDFAMMNRLAERVGYKFWVDGSTLYFVNPDVALSWTSTVPEFVLDGDGIHQDTLRSIRLMGGSLAPRADSDTSVREVYGLDADTGAPLRASSGQMLAQNGLVRPAATSVHPASVDSVHEARQVAEGAATGTWVSAEAMVGAESRVRPGSSVILSGESLHTDYHGDWLSSGTVQILTSDSGIQYSLDTQIDLTRNQYQSMEFARVDRVKGALRDVDCVLRDGTLWESEILGAVDV